MDRPGLRWESEWATDMHSGPTSIEATRRAVILTDAAGIVLSMNEAAEQLTLYRMEELVGQHSLVVLHDPMELSARAVQQSRQSGQPISAGFASLVAAVRPVSRELVGIGVVPEARSEWTLVRKDRSRVWARMTVAPQHDPDPALAGFRFELELVATAAPVGASSHPVPVQYDELTGLPNRSILNERLEQGMEQSRRFGHKLALFLLDLDHFGRVVHALGSHAEQTLLIAVARRLHSSVRSTDTVARLVGNQFAVVMPSLREAADAERCAELMLQTVCVPVVVSGRDVRLTASIGYCLYPEDASEAEVLLTNAELAMQAAKSAGRARCRAFSAGIQNETDDRLSLEDELRHAPERNEFRLEYQPQIDCREGRVIGMEALLRWSNAKRGHVPSASFIPLAEEIGMMVRIGEWSLRQACMDCARAQRELGRRLTVAVNISPQQFKQRGLPDMVDAALLASGLPPQDLEIEITERMLLEPTPCVLDTLARIRDRGVRIALDDFGTGFSSFSYLLQFGVDHLKIDRSFIAASTEDPSAATIVKTILSMARNLSIGVIAEGVETEAQREFLHRRRCGSIQGFLFSPAVPVDRLLEVVATIENKYATVHGSRLRTGKRKALRPPSLLASLADVREDLLHH